MSLMFVLFPMHQEIELCWCNVSSCAEGAVQSLPSLTAEQWEQHRGHKINEKKWRIASLASAIISDPNSNVRPCSAMFMFCVYLFTCSTCVFTMCVFVQIKRLKELRGMLMECDPCVAVTIRKLVMVSLMEIFKDITPSYRIRPLTPAEKAVKVTRLSLPALSAVLGWVTVALHSSLLIGCLVALQVKKETQQLREFEEGLVSQYKFYLEDLEQTIKGM